LGLLLLLYTPLKAAMLMLAGCRAAQTSEQGNEAF
jgi:hypothetical protein